MYSHFDDQTMVNANLIELPAPVVDGCEPTAFERSSGDFFPIWLRWLPHVGDLLKLNSRLNAGKKEKEARHYEVVKVVHILDDVSEDSPRPHEKKGNQFVNVYVKLSHNSLFEEVE